MFLLTSNYRWGLEITTVTYCAMWNNQHAMNETCLLCIYVSLTNVTCMVVMVTLVATIGNVVR